jgi:GNAT superfamily N-acetyltransferase
LNLSAPALLQKTHEVGSFESGESSLDDWLKRRALKNNAIGASRTFVVCDGLVVVGYYCVSASAVGHDIAPKFAIRGLPDPVPAILIGRLAVDKRYQGKKIGDFLVRDAFLKAISGSEILGIAVILVHALNPNSRRFWQSYGFIESPIQEMTLMLPMKTVLAAME